MEADDSTAASSRLKFDANNVLAAGFTTAEKKIDTLRQDGKNLSLLNIFSLNSDCRLDNEQLFLLFCKIFLSFEQFYFSLRTFHF